MCDVTQRSKVFITDFNSNFLDTMYFNLQILPSKASTWQTIDVVLYSINSMRNNIL